MICLNEYGVLLIPRVLKLFLFGELESADERNQGVIVVASVREEYTIDEVRSFILWQSKKL